MTHNPYIFGGANNEPPGLPRRFIPAGASPAARRRIARRRGLSLLEMLLVLALLVAVGAVVLPALRGPMDTYRLQSAADQVRAHWSKARLRAMQSGAIHAFLFQPATGDYRIEPWLDVGDEVEASASSAGDPASATAGVAPMTLVDALPEEIVFFEGDALADSRSMAAEQVAAISASSATDVPFGPPILFYPDGTTSTARLVVSNADSLAVLIELRGLTGVSRVSEFFALEELPQ